MRRLLTFCLLALAALLAVVPAAFAAKGPAPTITRVQPMRVSVGNLVTITGSHFNARRLKNTIIFRGPDGRTAFAKPRRATSRKLVVRVPAAVARLLNVAHSKQRPTRMKLRVLSGQFSKFTSRRLSPVITAVGDGDGGGGGGGDGGGGGTPTVCNSPSDYDGDLLPNSVELAIGTDPCLADTDNDQMSDGWEYYAAKDLNVKAVPYPGKRPFPNALDPSDGAPAGTGFSKYDFDGDGLTTLEEYRAWRYTGSSFDASKAGGLDLQSPLGYSDGTKYSRSDEVPSVPNWKSANYGLANPPQAFPATYNLWGDAPWRDDERDADRDGLSNWLESANGPGHADYWQGYWKVPARSIDPWKKTGYVCGAPGNQMEQRPGEYDMRPFADLDLADPDVDGDTLLDGEDDQDNDDYTNITELYEVVYDLDGNGAGGTNPPWCDGLKGAGVIPSIAFGSQDSAINPFNPCAPNPQSRTCPPYIPFS